MEPTNGQLEPAAEETGGLVTRDRHVFKVPAPKASLLGKCCVLSMHQITGFQHAKFDQHGICM